MAKTEVILTSNIVGLGAESDHVKVAAGYARNYLLPHALAIPVTSANKRRLESLRQRRAEREASDLNTMTDLSKSLQKLVAIIKVKTGDDGKMFGTVTNGMIADELKHQFDVTLDKKKVHLELPIRTLGEHEVALHLHADVKATLKIRVESQNPLPAPTAAPAPEVRKDDGRPDRRARRNEQVVITDRRPGKGERVPKADKAATAPKA